MKTSDIRADDLRLFLTDGGMAVRTQAGIAEALGLSKDTVRRYLTEMRGEVGKRYPEYAIAQPSGNLILVSTAAFWDFLCYRQKLLDRNLRGSVPKFDPAKVLSGLGVTFTLAA